MAQSQKRKSKVQGSGKPADLLPQGQYRDRNYMSTAYKNSTKENMSPSEKIQKFRHGGGVKTQRARGVVPHRRRGKYPLYPHVPVMPRRRPVRGKYALYPHVPAMPRRPYAKGGRVQSTVRRKRRRR